MSDSTSALLGAEAERAVFAPAGLQGHPEFTDAYMKADLEERIRSGGLPKEVGEEALRDLRDNPVSKEAWQDMQVSGAPPSACFLYRMCSLSICLSLLKLELAPDVQRYWLLVELQL